MVSKELSKIKNIESELLSISKFNQELNSDTYIQFSNPQSSKQLYNERCKMRLECIQGHLNFITLNIPQIEKILSEKNSTIVLKRIALIEDCILRLQRSILTFSQRQRYEDIGQLTDYLKELGIRLEALKLDITRCYTEIIQEEQKRLEILAKSFLSDVRHIIIELKDHTYLEIKEDLRIIITQYENGLKELTINNSELDDIYLYLCNMRKTSKSGILTEKELDIKELTELLNLCLAHKQALQLSV